MEEETKWRKITNRNEMTDSDHEELLKMLLQSKAKIMLSGYESDMYNDYLAGWGKKQFSSYAEHGKPRTETVWINYMHDAQQMSLMIFRNFTVKQKLSTVALA